MSFDASVSPDSYQMSDTIACPTGYGPGQPLLTHVPAVTNQLLQPLRGTATGAAYVVAKGATGTSRPVAVGANGSFCLEVQLMPDTSNTVEIVPYSHNTCEGVHAQIRLQHKTESKPSGPPTQPHNISKGQPISSSHKPSQGTLEDLVDGSSSSWARFSVWDPEFTKTCDAHAWIRIDLGKVYSLSKVRIQWANEAIANKTYATCYSILTSSKTLPVDPSPSATSDWRVIERPEGTAADVDVQMSGERARWVAVLLYENDTTAINQYERFEVGDIEVIGQDPDAVPPAPADRCN
jgi:hypothetical protein